MRLIVSGVACERGGRALFDGLGFTLEPGQAVILTGPNGAGKTSLLLILAGLLEPAAGEVVLEGEGGEAAEPSEDAHLVGHRDGLKSQLLVGENLAFWRALLGGPGLEPAEALAALGLGALHDVPAAYLSTGQRRRVALARLLVARRPLWLLDEPTAALDTASRARLAALMQSHLAEGGLIVAATHEPIGIAARELAVAP
jgi:heme exporter protein A